MKKLILTFFASLIFSPFLLGQWTDATPPPSDFRTAYSFGFSIGDIGYLVGGQLSTLNNSASMYSYAPDTDEWTQLPDFPGGTRGYGLGEVWNDKAYFGFGSASPGSDLLNDLWEYDPATEQWTELSSCPCSGRIRGGMVAHNGNVYVGFGDVLTGFYLNDWWTYNIESDTWTEKAEFPSAARESSFQLSIGDYIYAGLGRSGSGFTTSWFRYDPSNDTWSEMSNFPGESRGGGVSFTHNGEGFILSGYRAILTNPMMESGEFWKYDGAMDNWTELEAHPDESRRALASFIIDEEVHIYNGVRSQLSFVMDEAYKYNLGLVSGLNDVKIDRKNVEVYPNPFVDDLQLTIGERLVEDYSNVEVRVYSLLGELRQKMKIYSHNDIIDLSKLISGIYILEIYDQEVKVAVHKIVKSE